MADIIFGIELSVSDLLLTYQSLVSVARTDNSLRMIHLSVQIRQLNDDRANTFSTQRL